MSVFGVSQRPLEGKRALVTGASSGIGKAIAKHLAEAGAVVALSARRKEELEKFSQELSGSDLKSVVVQMDVTNRTNILQAITNFEAEVGPLDIVVNAAGVMYFTFFKNAHFDEWEQTIDVNCKGLVNTCGAVVPGMISRKHGHVVNISSDAARTVFPALSVYNASKSFVTTFSKSLRAELVGTGVRVTDIQPGDAATNLITKNTDFEAAEKLGVSIGVEIGTGAERNTYLDPNDIAKAVLYAVTAPTHVGINEILIEPRDQMWGDPTSMNTALSSSNSPLY